MGEGHMNAVSLLRYLHPTLKTESEKDPWAGMGQAQRFSGDMHFCCAMVNAGR